MANANGDVISRSIEATLNELGAGLVSAIPKLISGLLFLTLAYVGITLVLRLVRATLGRLYFGRQELIVDLLVSVAGIFLWFGAALTLLKIIGMEDIAASLGTATGFVALGVSYALSDMIADTVAGVYLLRDPDFNVGDRVSTESVTGTVTAIELRKSRIELDDGDTVVLANRDIEKTWTKKTSAKPAGGGDVTASDPDSTPSGG